MIGRIFAIGLVFGLACIGWMILGGVTTQRTHMEDERLGPEVQDLWGRPHAQHAPVPVFHWDEVQDIERTETKDGEMTKIVSKETITHDMPVRFSSTDVQVGLNLDQRLKGLMWFSLFNVGFNGRWTYKHQEPRAGKLTIAFDFPLPDGLYDGFHFIVNGEDRAPRLQPQGGRVVTDIDVHPGDELSLEIGYNSRGSDEWRYLPAEGVVSLENFRLGMTTDFENIDFPAGTISPGLKTPTGTGMALTWQFAQVVTGQGMGMRMPSRIQPGELAAALAFSAPISLLFFFLVIFVLGTLRRIDIHPVNYLFIAGAFYAFHLLFAYSVDHMALLPAFVMSSAVSLVLVVSYLRLVVSARFAFIEAALAQVLYLVGFSLAHFWEGFTGLTVTILSILTLFLLMQLTGRVRWSEVFARTPGRRPADPTPESAPLPA